MMEVDSKLKFSCENFQDNLVGDISNITLHNEISEPYPSLSILVQLAWKVYTNMGSDEHDVYEKKINLPDGWKLLTTAYNKGWKNGYFGATFWSPPLQQVVVSHRGTKPSETGAMWTNFTGVVLENDSDRMISAITFVDKVKCAIHEANKSRNRFHLSITGHSLGGWLAQITGLTVKYLQAAEDRKFIKNCNQRNALHAHIVAFDSPGCKNMLDDIVDKCDYRYRRTVCLEALDISNYLSAPNSINTFGLHVGSLYRVMIDVKTFGFLQRFTGKFTLAAHSIESLVKAIKNNNMIHAMKDWPISHVLASPEYDNFHQEGSKANEYHLDIKEDEFNMELRYKPEGSDNSGSLRIFSDDELKLLQFWIIFKKETVQTFKIQTFLTKHNLGECKDLFENFKIDIKNHTIICDSKKSLEIVIKRAKLLVRWFREELMEAVDQQSTEIPAMMYFMATENYLNFLPKCQMNFQDTMGFQKFLESDEHGILHIKTEDSELEVARLYNVFCQLQEQSTCHQNLKDYLEKNNQTFIHWKQMATLVSIVDYDNLYETNFTRDNLLVIDCSSLTGASSALGGEKMIKQFLNNKLQVKKKLILVSPQHSDSEILLKSFDVPVKNVPLKNVELNDLTEEAQTKLFVRKMLFIGGETLSLVDYAGMQNFIVFLSQVNSLLDAQRLKNIVIDQNYVIELKDPLLNRDDLHVHSALNREVNVTRITSILRDRSSSALLVISGVEREEMRIEEWGDLLDSIEVRVTTAVKAEPLFKQLCREQPNKEIYWLDMSAGLRCKQMYKKDFYMGRKFFNQIVFNFNLTENILMDKGFQDIFIFQNVSDKESLMDLLLFKGSKKEFMKNENIQTAITENETEDIIKRNYDRPVHVLKFNDDGDHCLWLHSQGSLDGLRQYVTTDNSGSIDEVNFCKIKQKVVIIADEPGMGKTTSLMSMSRKFESAWVIRIILKDFLIPIQNLPPILSLHSVTEFLLGENLTKDSLLHKLLQFCLQHEHSRQIYLLFDGFDEIKEDPSKNINTKNVVLKLLKYFKNKTTAKVWVTTRLYLKGMLENGLDVFATQFQSISERQQREYILKFWRSHLILELNSYGDAEESKLVKSSRDLYGDVKEALGTDVNRFMGVLLQTRMLAEIFIKPIKDNVESEVETSFKVKSVLDLYQKLVTHKFYIYFSDKTNLITGMSSSLQNSNVELFTEQHGMLSIFTLFPEFANENFDDSKDELTPCGAELNRVGMVQWSRGGIKDIEFTHRTLAEYFCADLIFQWLRKKGRYLGYAPIEELLLTEILLHDSHKVIRTFINKLVLSQPLTRDVDKFSSSKISKVWQEKQHLLFNRMQKTALHIAVEEGNDGIIDILIGGFKCEPVHKALIAFVAAHDREGDTALGLAAQRAGSDESSEIMKNADSEVMKKIIQSIKTCQYDVILELLLATYIRFTFVLPNRIRLLNNYLEGEAVGSKLLEAFVRTKKILQEEVPPFLTSVMESRAESVDELFYKLENDTERHYMLLAPDDKSNTALHLAAQDKHNEALNRIQTRIFRNICNHNMPGIGRSYDEYGRTPLHCAAAAGHLDIVQHLKNYGVHIDSLSVHEETALIYAAHSGHFPVVKYLVEEGADINILDNTGCTVLFVAAVNGHLTITKYLVKKGASFETLDNIGRTALFQVAVNGYLPMAKYIIEKGVSVDTLDKNGHTALFAAACAGQLAMVEYLIEKSASIDTLDNVGRTALFEAAGKGHLPITEYLVEKGASIDILNNVGRTALFEAALNGHLPTARYLVAKGVRVDTLDNVGRTALFEAALKGHLPMTKYLVEKGVSVDTLDNNGQTALFAAVSAGHLPIAEYLIGKGASVDTLDKDGYTVLTLAISHGQRPMTEYLLEKGASIDIIDNIGRTALFIAAVNEDLPMAKYVVEKGGSVDTLSKNGHTALFEAAFNGNLPMAKYLVEKGLSIDTLDNDGQTALFAAASAGQLPMVEYLVENGASIYTLNIIGCTALFEAAFNGHLPMAKYLVEKGVKVDTLDKNGRTALFEAAINGHLTLARYIIEKGVSIDTLDKNGYTALIVAASHGQLSMVEYLVENGASIDILDFSGHGALFEACINGHISVTEYLIEKGASIYALDNIGRTALFETAFNGHLPMAKYIIEKGVNIDTLDKNGHTALFAAASAGQFAVVNYLVKKGSNINLFDKNGFNVLYHAAAYGSLPLVEYFVKKGVAINSLDKDGDITLLSAMSNGHLCVSKYLIDNGASIDILDNNGRTALFFAAFNGHLPMAEYIIEKGVNVHTLDKNGRTALFEAAINGHLTLARYIIEKGVSIDTLDKNGHTALFAAASAGQFAMVNYLEEKGSNINMFDKNGCNVLFHAVTNGSLPLVEYFVEKGVAINSLDKDGDVTLFSAISNGHICVSKYLIDNGASIDILDNNGRTALFFAAFNGHLPVAEYLIEKGVNLNILDKDGCTAVFYAASAGHLPVVIFLVGMGADINSEDKEGNTPLSRAAEMGHFAVVVFLVDKGAIIKDC